MNASFRNVMKAVLLISSLAIPTPSHAWFFFFLPGLFSNNDKKTVAELEQKQDWTGMHELAEKRLATNDKEPAWHYINGLALHKLYRCGEAIPQFQRALELKADNREAQHEVGICQYETGQLDDAVSTFTAVIGKYPDYWQAYYNLGLVYVRKQDPANARIYLEQLRSRNMVMANKLEETSIKPLESRLEREKIAAANREKEEKERIERERTAKEDADAKAKTEAEAATGAEKLRLSQVEAAKKPQESLEERLKELKQLYTKGLITKDVYSVRQKELLIQH